MIKGLIPYLIFEGNAEEALNFYNEVFGAEKVNIMRFGDSQMPVDEEYKNKIMHARLEHKTFNLYFSDTFQGEKVEKGANVSLTLEFETEEAIDKTYATLSEGGNVYMELQKTFWNAKYAKLTDKFGVTWDLNYQY
ncbi:VOC family protein [Clostridium sp. DJ247]|uniref:VOC family protein n=1 Tax=Clostridium sp. DJ247 TaxID=2726188 RepID=UPI001625C226|nr:glyoxalase/bleomycin resistance/extradiol dioxygenase family protein [Clostridium sp. DJ247]MBC2578877.1 glyoxalase/bleomycin resistance/extradiol dioxygenase family protein [Clostridium sp. DJ247]